VAGGRNFFQHGELALVVLALVRRRPMHGYDLLAELARVLPSYRPSPGSVYPALAALVEEGLVETAGDSGRRRVYRITRVGRDALARRRSALAAFEVRTGARLGTREDAEAALDRLRARVLAVAERVDPDRLDSILDSAAREVEAAVEVGEKRESNG